VDKNSENYASISVITIRNVVKGILGVAIIQTMMAALGFFIAGGSVCGFVDHFVSDSVNYPSWSWANCNSGCDLHVFCF
jgi:hypothetical protein